MESIITQKHEKNLKSFHKISSSIPLLGIFQRNQLCIHSKFYQPGCSLTLSRKFFKNWIDLVSYAESVLGKFLVQLLAFYMDVCGHRRMPFPTVILSKLPSKNLQYRIYLSSRWGGSWDVLYHTWCRKQLGSPTKHFPFPQPHLHHVATGVPFTPLPFHTTPLLAPDACLLNFQNDPSYHSSPYMHRAVPLCPSSPCRACLLSAVASQQTTSPPVMRTTLIRRQQRLANNVFFI